jgi:hypothetical protein
MAADWTLFEMIAEGWRQAAAELPEGDRYRNGLDVCARQLEATIARAKADEDD